MGDLLVNLWWILRDCLYSCWDVFSVVDLIFDSDFFFGVRCFGIFKWMMVLVNLFKLIVVVLFIVDLFMKDFVIFFNFGSMVIRIVWWIFLLLGMVWRFVCKLKMICWSVFNVNLFCCFVVVVKVLVLLWVVILCLFVLRRVEFCLDNLLFLVEMMRDMIMRFVKVMKIEVILDVVIIGCFCIYFWVFVVIGFWNVEICLLVS